MAKNFLIITEGVRTEPNILEFIFTKYGFNVIRQEPIRIEEKKQLFDLDIIELAGDRDNIVIAQGPKNRIGEFLKLFDNQSEDIERYFSEQTRNFSGIFLIYDVDHTSNDDLANMFIKFQDETSSGLLILSSPCIEILSEPNRREVLHVNHLTEYKKERKTWVQDNYSYSIESYIVNHFEDLVLAFLKKNCEESGSDNVMEHPEFVLNQINAYNERTYVSRDLQPVLYRYFTTTLYVCIAYILGLTKEIDNSAKVAEFFSSHK